MSNALTSALSECSIAYEAIAKATAEAHEAQIAECETRIDNLCQAAESAAKAHEEELIKVKAEFGSMLEVKTNIIDQLTKENEALRIKAEAQPTAATPRPKPTNKYANAIKHRDFDYILDIMKDKEIPFLVGPAGTGKNVIAEMLAEHLKLPFYTSARVTKEYLIEGYEDGKGDYHETPFFKAFTQGGVFFFDEMDASDASVLELLNAAFANRYFTFPHHGLVQAHKDFYPIAAGNSYGTGSDAYIRNILDAATLNRFGCVDVDYDERIELKCANGNKELVNFVHDLRKSLKKCNCENMMIVSYRNITQITKFEAKHGIAKTLKTFLIKGVDRDNIEIIFNNLTNKINKYAKALNAFAFGLEQAA